MAAVHPYGLMCLRTDVAETTRLEESRQLVVAQLEGGAAGTRGPPPRAAAAAAAAVVAAAAAGPQLVHSSQDPSGFNRRMEQALASTSATPLELVACCNPGHAVFKFCRTRLGLHPQPLSGGAAASAAADPMRGSLRFIEVEGGAPLVCFASDGHVALVSALVGDSSSSSPPQVLEDVAAVLELQAQLSSKPVADLAPLGFASSGQRTLQQGWQLHLSQTNIERHEEEFGSGGGSRQLQPPSMINVGLFKQLAAHKTGPTTSGPAPSAPSLAPGSEASARILQAIERCT